MLCPPACKAAFTVFVAQGKRCNLPRLGTRCNQRALRAFEWPIFLSNCQQPDTPGKAGGRKGREKGTCLAAPSSISSRIPLNSIFSQQTVYLHGPTLAMDDVPTTGRPYSAGNSSCPTMPSSSSTPSSSSSSSSSSNFRSSLRSCASDNIEVSPCTLSTYLRISASLPSAFSSFSLSSCSSPDLCTPS